MMPTSVSDDAVKGTCQSCFSEFIFERCPECGFDQAIPTRWQSAFTCGRCEEKVEIPRTGLYSTSTKARAVQGYGYSYPRF
jgi:ribosomal protein S27E